MCLLSDRLRSIPAAAAAEVGSEGLHSFHSLHSWAMDTYYIVAVAVAVGAAEWAPYYGHIAVSIADPVKAAKPRPGSGLELELE